MSEMHARRANTKLRHSSRKTNRLTRRQFGAAVGSTSLALSQTSSAFADESELEKHRITAIEFKSIDGSWPRPVGRNASKGAHGHKNQHLACILRTDQGASAWGIANGVRRMIESITDRVKGQTVASLISADHGILDSAWRPLDIALHDLAGVILQQPVWKMVSRGQRQTPFVTRVYSGMIYFDDLDPPERPSGVDQVLRECRWDYDYGYRQFKVKIGRGHRWMKPAAAGMKRDIEVVSRIHEAFPECDILVDANNGYHFDDCVEFLSGVRHVPLFWLEEPFHETVEDYRRLHDWAQQNGRTQMRLADGEAKPDTAVLESLQEAKILDVRLEDILGLGFTNWRNLLPRLMDRGVEASPHAWGAGLKTIYIAHLIGGLGGAPTIEGVTQSHADVDFGDNVILDGNQQVSSVPGFGLTLRT
ncbi:MAG: enolase C-terminal domain-like protein [Rubripirellula sp.]